MPSIFQLGGIATAVLSLVMAMSFPHSAHAQDLAGEPEITELHPARAEPFIDRKVEGFKERVSGFLARYKKEHFTRYLAAYCTILAAVTGVVFGLCAYKLSDPISPYRNIKRRSLQLAAAIGGALGIFGAVMQVPPNTIGKVSLLLMCTGVGMVATVVGTWLSFVLLRMRSNHLARRDGRRITDRMRHA